MCKGRCLGECEILMIFSKVRLMGMGMKGFLSEGKNSGAPGKVECSKWKVIFIKTTFAI